MAATPKTNYHHGDLRNAVIARALEILEDGGADALSLRIIARDLGVSQPAPYHHFANRGDLLAALAARGFERLASGLQRNLDASAAQERRELGESIADLMRGYVRFAQKRPHLFQLMFNGDLERTGHSDLALAASTSYRTLHEHVKSLLQAHEIDAEGAHATATIWSLQHGIASLIVGGATSSDAAKALSDVDGLLEHAGNTLAQGFKAKVLDQGDGERHPAGKSNTAG